MKYFIRLILLFFMLCAVSVQADMRIVITKGVNTARPIAIIPFSWSGAGQPPENLSEIIASDLQNSGKFNPVDKKNMPEIPTAADDINSALWAKKGIDSVIMGSIKPTEDGQFLISYKMIDTVTSPGATLAENQFVVSHQWLRYAAHTVSDEVFEKLTGIKGAFRTRIAYIVKMNKSSKYTHELRVSDYDGFGQITLHRSNAPLMSPAWSVDGKKIAFVTFEGGHSSLVLKTLATGELETIAAYPRHNGAPAFSPDGKKLAFVLSKDGSLNLYVMDLATKRIKQVTMGRSNNTEPSWMPDSEHIVYTSDQAGNPQVYEVNINTLAIQRLTWDGSQNQNAAASPDGKFIIMIRTDNGRQNVARLDLDSGAVQILADTFLDETPSLSPNGIMVIYSSSQGLGNILQLVSTDGRFKARLPATDGQITFPAWSPYL